MLYHVTRATCNSSNLINFLSSHDITSVDSDTKVFFCLFLRIDGIFTSTVHCFCCNIGSSTLHFHQRKILLKPSFRVRCYKRDNISFTCQLLTKLNNDRQTQKSKEDFAHPSARINEQFLSTKSKTFTNKMFLKGKRLLESAFKYTTLAWSVQQRHLQDELYSLQKLWHKYVKGEQRQKKEAILILDTAI